MALEEEEAAAAAASSAAEVAAAAALEEEPPAPLMAPGLSPSAPMFWISTDKGTGVGGLFGKILGGKS